MLTDQDIASRAYSRLNNLASRDERDVEAATMQIIAEAVAAGRREGELGGVIRGSGYASDAVSYVFNSVFTTPLTRQPLSGERE